MRKLVYIVGTGRSAFYCAMEARKYCKAVKIFEYNIDVLSGLEKLAQKHDIEYERFREELFYSLLKSERNDILILSVLNRYIFKEDIINMPNVKIINYHPGLLPNHKGTNPEAWAIYEGDNVAGVTWHIITNKVDCGNIIIQKKIEIGKRDTSVSLFLKLNKLAEVAFSEIIESVIMDCEVEIPQEKVKGEFHYFRDIPNDGFLDLNWDDNKKSAFLRSMDYGKLYTLGKIKVVVDDNTYIANGYSIVEHCNFMSNNSDCIVIKGTYEDVILKGVKRYDQCY